MASCVALIIFAFCVSVQGYLGNLSEMMRFLILKYVGRVPLIENDSMMEGHPLYSDKTDILKTMRRNGALLTTPVK
ncbi:Hypothetical protein CpCap5W_0959 [Corynebacterium pseudotuberculosis]|uniref:Uncharacterized protein n=1 Tax=Corynebacterium pseudotuberculosis (strain C231) TaxID=681645 RepID=D9QC75_CORP2|nr:hypothetical protein CPC231_08575 [Corynebacterium pseudotuberculosis C231]ADL21565.1 hypothetical protein CP1002_04570 [Corynebacterium pseudotuberculosis 1002]ADO26960.1 hypothetical protein CPI19_08580 [Corynebacterium pseudotuberculosis I19]AEK93024.1 Hypothetical protein CpPAT10_1698 [Corynebacterium pseudotuberculosis PAT10]AFF22850.1 Hypothetical protein CpP54B96_1727 [Corynebacterium pseudotuberculosis P54B96]AFH52649.1 Hypothetical protein Cp267_1767 [Corynebacterium pseudotubercul